MSAATIEGLTGRLAPSPTGVLHLGNARSFLLAWLSIRSRGGRLLMRIEDIDGPRLKAGATESALEDLAWLGLDHDGEVMLQSGRLEQYDTAVDRLLAAGLAYPCVCSRKEVEEAASAPHETWQDAVPYPGTCRGRYADCAEAEAESGRVPAVRLRVDVASLPFIDGFRGPEDGLIRGDFVIRKRDGGPAYQLAVVVDDAATGVTEVLRGDDLLVSTPRQLLLYQLLDLPAPDFVHVPLVVGEDGLRLAKRHGDTSLAHFRSAGVEAEQVLGYLGWSCGLRQDCEPCGAADLLEGFELASLPRDPAVAGPPWFEPR
ncbi:MAG: tRNA glutamyl-Q(34) synthetase GluQRS [Planctomycetota bacterium]|nr:tRNA glutamyl-Q(34) synthetase GluQRS [Planctomycetota bacterium]